MASVQFTWWSEPFPLDSNTIFTIFILNSLCTHGFVKYYVQRSSIRGTKSPKLFKWAWMEKTTLAFPAFDPRKKDDVHCARIEHYLKSTKELAAKLTHQFIHKAHVRMEWNEKFWKITRIPIHIVYTRCSKESFVWHFSKQQQPKSPISDSVSIPTKFKLNILGINIDM